MMKIIDKLTNERRLKNLNSKRQKVRSKRNDLQEKQANAVINDDEDLVSKLRAEIQVTEQMIIEFERAITEIQQRIDAGRRAEEDFDRAEHQKAAAQYGEQKLKAATQVDAALQSLEKAIVDYRRLTVAEARELAETQRGSKVSPAPLIRLQHRLRAAIWKACPRLCREAGLARLSAARWQSLADSHQHEIADPDAAQMKRA